MTSKSNGTGGRKDKTVGGKFTHWMVPRKLDQQWMRTKLRRSGCGTITRTAGDRADWAIRMGTWIGGTHLGDIREQVTCSKCLSIAERTIAALVPAQETPGKARAKQAEARERAYQAGAGQRADTPATPPEIREGMTVRCQDFDRVGTGRPDCWIEGTVLALHGEANTMTVLCDLDCWEGEERPLSPRVGVQYVIHLPGTIVRDWPGRITVIREAN